MNVVALSARSFASSVAKAAGVKPLLFPPLNMETVSVSLPSLAQADFWYVKLHGLAGQGYWYGDDWLTAVSAEQLQQVKFNNTIIFAANCFTPNSPMLYALLSSGTQCVIAGEGENYGGTNNLLGADLLGYDFRRLVQARFSPKRAFQIAMLKQKTRRGKTKADIDTLQFKFYERKKVQHERN